MQFTFHQVICYNFKQYLFEALSLTKLVPTWLWSWPFGYIWTREILHKISQLNYISITESNNKKTIHNIISNFNQSEFNLINFSFLPISFKAWAPAFWTLWCESLRTSINLGTIDGRHELNCFGAQNAIAPNNSTLPIIQKRIRK